MALLPKRAPRQQRHYTATYYLGSRRLRSDSYTRKQVNDGTARADQLIFAKAQALGLKITHQGYPRAGQHNDTTVRFSIDVEYEGKPAVFHLNWS